MRYLSLTIPGVNGTPTQVDSGLPGNAPSGGIFNYKVLDAQGNPTVGGTGTDIIRTLVILLVIGAVLFALWAAGKTGWDLITSRGHKEKIKTDAQRIFYVVFGLIMVFLSFVFLGIAKAFFGVDLLPFLKF